MPVLLLILGLAVLAATIYVAMGLGGEQSRERADYAPVDLGPVSAADVALLRPPSNGWGYSKAATDEALDRIALAVRERDVRIVALEQLVTDLSRDHAPVALGEPIPGARHRRSVKATGTGAEALADAESEALAAAPVAEAREPEAEIAEPETAAGEPDTPEETTLPQPAVPPVTWPSGPALSSWPRPDSAAVETTQPQPAVREPSDAETRSGTETTQPQQRVRSTGERRQPPPERSHG